MPPATMVSRLGHSTKKKSLHKALFDSFFKIRGSVKAAQEPRLLDAAFEFELNGRWRGDARAPLPAGHGARHCLQRLVAYNLYFC